MKNKTRLQNASSWEPHTFPDFFLDGGVGHDGTRPFPQTIVSVISALRPQRDSPPSQENGMHCTFLTFSTDQEFFNRFGCCCRELVPSFCCCVYLLLVDFMSSMCYKNDKEITLYNSFFLEYVKTYRRGWLQLNSSIISSLCYQEYFRVQKTNVFIAPFSKKKKKKEKLNKALHSLCVTVYLLCGFY